MHLNLEYFIQLNNNDILKMFFFFFFHKMIRKIKIFKINMIFFVYIYMISPPFKNITNQ